MPQFSGKEIVYLCSKTWPSTGFSLRNSLNMCVTPFMSIKLLVQKKCHHSAFDTRGLPWKPSMGQSHVVVSDVQGRTGTSPCNNTFSSTFGTTVPRATLGKGVGEGYSTLPRDDFTSYMLLGLLSRFRLPVKPRSNDFKEQGEEGLSQGAVTRTQRPQGERPSLVQGGLSHMYWFCFFLFLNKINALA